MKFTEKLAKMMYGRYGSDNLNRFLVFTACILTIVNIFISSIIITTVALIFLIICTVRMFSKNILARQKENARYLKISTPITGKFKLIKNKFKDRKTHVYKKCPKCKSVLRLPKKKGDHTVVCPKCRERFDVKI